MTTRTRLALHAFGLRAIGVAIVTAQTAFGVFTVIRLHGWLGALAGSAVVFTAGSNFRALQSWWSDPL